jgi:hypothetical protein
LGDRKSKLRKCDVNQDNANKCEHETDRKMAVEHGKNLRNQEKSSVDHEPDPTTSELETEAKRG